MNLVQTTSSILIGTGYSDVTKIILVEGVVFTLKIMFHSSSRIFIQRNKCTLQKMAHCRFVQAP